VYAFSELVANIDAVNVLDLSLSPERCALPLSAPFTVRSRLLICTDVATDEIPLLASDIRVALDVISASAKADELPDFTTMIREDADAPLVKVSASIKISVIYIRSFMRALHLRCPLRFLIGRQLRLLSYL